MPGRSKSKSKSKAVATGVGKGLNKSVVKVTKKSVVKVTKKKKSIEIVKKKKIVQTVKKKKSSIGKEEKKKGRITVADISNGKEQIPISAVNEVDDEPPPAFTYVSRMEYPTSKGFEFVVGCNCDGECSDDEEANCWCAVKNDGEMPYNDDREIVYAKQVVHECGLACKCPPSCRNRATQQGIKLPLEIFKTEKKGWALRCSTDIPSGTFVCEYVGELLQESEAEQRVGHDEYLFDIGRKSVKGKIRNSYTIDAADFANVGRFVNHSCDPNLYAQNVLYDVDDENLPHVMFFTTEKVPALQELTYNYNYAVGRVRDADGRIKMKECYCGAAKCRGRLY